MQAVEGHMSVGSVPWTIAKWKFCAEHHSSFSLNNLFLNLFLFYVYCVRVSELLELELETGAALWVLGIEPRSSQRTTSAPDCGAISPALVRILFLNPRVHPSGN